ncbi:MAG: cupin domain-containing protein, partial [Sediminibacterium sp.]|nr:cupin domain-containing protein [Sediminibacterium sp.]
KTETNIEGLPLKTIATGLTGKYIHSTNMTIGFVNLEVDAIIPAHQHIHEQITWVEQGVLELSFNNQTYTLHKGDFVIIPSNIIHQGKAITACKVIDTFYPMREDLK